MTASEPTLQFETLDEYCLIVLRHGIANADWSKIEASGGRVVEHLSQATKPKVLVDLTGIDYISSAVVALLVRFWKAVEAQDGQMVVVNTHRMVAEVLKIAGLLRIWTVVATREEALHKLGLSREAKVERRESRLLIVAATVMALLAAAGLAARFIKPDLLPPEVWLTLIYGGGALAVVLGAFSASRRTGGLRVLAILTVLIGLGAIATDIAVWRLRIAPAQPADPDDEDPEDAPQQEDDPQQPASEPADELTGAPSDVPMNEADMGTATEPVDEPNGSLAGPDESLND